jgi:hypothetical protein
MRQSHIEPLALRGNSLIISEEEKRSFFLLVIAK